MNAAASVDTDKLWDLIKDSRFAVLAHRHADDGLLHSHPLTTQNKSLDADATLYFTIPKNGVIARELSGDGTVNLAYTNVDASYVSVAGHAALTDDLAKKKEVFSAMAKSWFPKGVDDSNLGLLAVRIVCADHWDVSESKTTQLCKMVRSAVQRLGDARGLPAELHLPVVRGSLWRWRVVTIH